MIIDHRTYTVRHGHMKQYLEQFERVALPIQLRHLGKFIGSFVSDIGPQNQVVHIWAYDDITDRETRRANMAADPEWQAFLTLNAGSFVAQENKILKPTTFTKL
ncbi:hypothetical protein RU07_08360 [Agrobacterium tumefaciens]|uniref:NIPSNAP domain-containing protein n=1 Tax=Agrobacterium tumefaciens TaxID=358 RepID=A0A0D0JC62_AGRTU|nr:hypothetical protein RU07_08360 [Agrobacterium tumefaciens]